MNPCMAALKPGRKKRTAGKITVENTEKGQGVCQEHHCLVSTCRVLRYLLSRVPKSIGHLHNPANQVREVWLANFLVINDLVHKELLRILAADWSRFFQGTGRIFEVVILLKRYDVRGGEGGEDVGSIRNIQCNSWRGFMHINDKVRYLGINLVMCNWSWDFYSFRLFRVLNITLSPML